MGQLKPLALTTLLIMSAGAAAAADLGYPAPAPLPAPAVEFAGGWYLRGDIGFTNQKVDKLENAALVVPGDRIETFQKEFDAAPLFGVGVGYQFNNFLRFDVTGEYRARSKFSAAERVGWAGSPAGSFNQTNEFTASKTEYVAMLNAYVDLGTWHGITPFIGAGVGAAHVSIDNFRDAAQGFDPFTGVGFTGLATSTNSSRTNLAWALMAGLGYQATENLTLELGYRYINLGDGETGDTTSYTGVNNIPDSWKFKDITSHDLKFGMRWALGGETYYEPRGPIVTKY